MPITTNLVCLVKSQVQSSGLLTTSRYKFAILFLHAISIWGICGSCSLANFFAPKLFNILSSWSVRWRWYYSRRSTSSRLQYYCSSLLRNRAASFILTMLRHPLTRVIGCQRDGKTDVHIIPQSLVSLMSCIMKMKSFLNLKVLLVL